MQRIRPTVFDSQSPRKIDAVASDALAYEARADAIAAGWTAKPAGPGYIRLPR